MWEGNVVGALSGHEKWTSQNRLLEINEDFTWNRRTEIQDFQRPVGKNSCGASLGAQLGKYQPEDSAVVVARVLTDDVDRAAVFRDDSVRNPQPQAGAILA